MKNKSSTQLVKHPYNNANWMYLAHFMMDDNCNVELSGVEQRVRERERIRCEMQAKRQAKDSDSANENAEKIAESKGITKKKK